MFQPVILLIGLALLAPAAHAAEFTILLYESKQDINLRNDKGPEGKTYWAEYTQFAGVLAKAGAMRDGAALQVSAKTAKANGLQLGGYFKIEAADLAAAQALAQQAPSVRRGGAVEVRPNVPNPEMPSK
jgi:hypothetical protein